LKSRNGSLSEVFVQKLLRQIAVGIKQLMEKKITLEFICPQSFCFKSFESEDNFKVKFFDYGLCRIFNDIYYQRSYLLNEGILGEIKHQKTNILGLGLTVFKLLFGDNIYKFKSEETMEESMHKLKSKFFTFNRKVKPIKITKSVSKECKYFIEKTCHLNLEKRYDWKNLLDDSFIKIQYNEDILIMSPKLQSSG